MKMYQLQADHLRVVHIMLFIKKTDKFTWSNLIPSNAHKVRLPWFFYVQRMS